MKISSSHLKYGKALYSVALVAKLEDKVLDDMESLSRLFQVGALRKMMVDVCYLDSADQEKVINAIFQGKLQDLTMNLLVLLARAKKLEIVPQISEVFRKQYHFSKGIKAVTVCSARKLAPEETQKLMKSLEDNMKVPLDVRFTEEPELIGGVQIYEGSSLTDYSVKNYLELLRKHLLTQ